MVWMPRNPKQFIIDGEAVLLTFDGMSDFNALHSRRHDELVQLYARTCAGCLVRAQD